LDEEIWVRGGDGGWGSWKLQWIFDHLKITIFDVNRRGRAKNKMNFIVKEGKRCSK
jgi:hypothetical protein